MEQVPGLTALLDALQEDVLAASDAELHDAQRATGRAWHTACQEIRSLLGAAAARSEEAAAAVTPSVETNKATLRH